MVTIERMRRPFWMHQLVEYILGFALIMTSIQQPEPRIPALMGLVILLNAAIVAGRPGRSSWCRAGSTGISTSV